MTFDTRKKELTELIPHDVESVLDIGCQNRLFEKYKTITLDVGENADIIQDLNKSQKIPLKENEVDLVVLSQILEHLVTVDEIVTESKRVAKKYILVGLPNEVKLDTRFMYLFGKCSAWGSYVPYGHKHFFIIKNIEKFIERFFGGYEKRYYLYGISGGRFIPLKIRKILAKIFPTLFAGQAYYLIKVNSRSKDI